MTFDTNPVWNAMDGATTKAGLDERWDDRLAEAKRALDSHMPIGWQELFKPPRRNKLIAHLSGSNLPPKEVRRRGTR